MKKNFVLLIVSIVIITITSACSTTAVNEGGYKVKSIRIHSGVTFAYAIQQIMRIDGLLEKHLPEGVAIEWENLGIGSANQRDAMMAGKLDISGLSLLSYITAVENGLPLVLISGNLPQPFALYTTRGDINSFSDINESQRICMSDRGTNVEMTFTLRCREVFGDATKFNNNIVNLTDADMVSLVQSDDTYELYAVGFPSLQIMEKLDNTKLVEDLTETSIKYGIGVVFVTTEKFYEDNPALMNAFRKALEEAGEYIQENPEEAAQKLAEYYGEVTAEDVLTLLKKCPVNFKIQNYDEISEVLLEMGILSKPAMKFTELPYYNEIPR